MRIRKFLNSIGINAANPPSPLPPSVIAVFNSLKKGGSREVNQVLTLLREEINPGQFPSNPPLIISKEIKSGLGFLNEEQQPRALACMRTSASEVQVLQGMMEFRGIKKKKRSQRTRPNKMFLTKSFYGGVISSSYYKAGKEDQPLPFKKRRMTYMMKQEGSGSKKAIVVSETTKAMVSYEGKVEETKKGKGGRKRIKESMEETEKRRCSRVNGRGWRCSMTPLNGYALCPHHLRKTKISSIKNTKATAIKALKY